ncbi:RdgB/HAM1 family non-canonical purine NTP pyrophosphatase [Nesterenkonia flava]|uniref:dITP/XTP pyrophosphatase n=1 Tax=Nesterenkonia flava TaxID=469799 RepID=A0ABU1FS28_9MICC|nr:RdgB/HAM1 family non-canonical purine NTP pyrophosphatase [Nesterenkonia flava]MDR5711449.1 RdgB/HAM1 family non-canonical purine NTP pyrophosphatase [Nesterenkonia flava]
MIEQTTPAGATGALVVLATRNQGKVRELRALLASLPGLEAVDLETAVIDAVAAGCSEIPETGVTFEENSLIKAREVARQTGLPAVADDSGLAVEVLGGAPGIFSARWAGTQASDEANLQLLLEQLADISDEHRAAAFVCAASLVLPSGDEYVEHGRLQGTLLRAPRGDGGFGYDPILQPLGESRSCAELSMQEKNAISHRGKAFAALAPRIAAVLQAAR